MSPQVKGKSPQGPRIMIRLRRVDLGLLDLAEWDIDDRVYDM